MTQTYWKRAGLRCLFALATILALAAPAIAQQTLGSLNGTVLDPSGAAISDATVTVTNSQIDFTRTTKSQGNGFFQVFNLPIGTYKVTVSREGFETESLPTIVVQEARATTVNASLKLGQTSETVEVDGTPLLNATDATNGYTLDSAQIAETPLATGSFTQLAVLAPGVSADLLSGIGSNAGLGNQLIQANGQRSTSNTMQINGADVTNIFNGMTSSGDASQRYNFNIGAGSTSSSSSAGAATIGGANSTATSVYGSNGNSLPTPIPEFTEEIRVNTSMYDAQQGATSGAQIDVNTKTGTNQFHGQLFGTFANNSLNASPFFFNQAYQLSGEGIGAFPENLQNPALHRWTTGATVGGPLWKSKLYFFLGYQHLYDSDQATGLSQMTVPSALSDDRSVAGIQAAATSWNNGKAYTGAVDPIAESLLQAKLPNGQYLIPSAQTNALYRYGVPNVTLIGTSLFNADQANASIAYDVSTKDRIELKGNYQNDPAQQPFNYSQTGGFPVRQNNTAYIVTLDNTIAISSRFNWEQRIGFVRQRSYGHYDQTLVNPAGDGAFGIGTGVPFNDAEAGQPADNIPAYNSGLLPGLLLESFADKQVSSPALKVGPYSSFANMGYAQNKVNPSTNLILALGKHTIVAGGGYSYSQLNVDNNRTGLAQVKVKNFQTFLTDTVASSSILESIAQTGSTSRNNADRYYRSPELDGYVQDKWQAMSNLSITAGVRYDYHGGLTEKYGNIFNFDPATYNVTGTAVGGFAVNDAGFVVAKNNKQNSHTADYASNDSTLSGRQWGISPRVGFAWAPKQNGGRVVFNGGFGVYFDRGEYFSYLSQPAGSGNGGPFGVTEAAPLADYINGTGKTLANPIGPILNTTAAPSADPSTITDQLGILLNKMTGSSKYYGPNCGGIDNQEGYTDCPDALNFGAYNKKNVLPYTMNWSFSMQWQPMNDLSVKIGYVGNLGRHAIVPIPLNEPGIATATSPIHGETDTYGFEVLNQNSFPDGYDYAPIAGEPWNTEDGGNTDFRVPYVGYSPNAAIFTSAGNSSYSALETHIEKRLSHHFTAGASYTWSHTLDEQSAVGLFFTGNNPNDLRKSYSSSDFDRTNIFSTNFDIGAPNVARDHSALSYVTNDWHLTGVGIVQSGEPYSLYEFYGAVGSVFFGDYPTLPNPVLPIKNPSHPYSALTGNSGKLRGTGGSYIPAIDPSQIAINYLAPGQDGVPVSTGNDPQDIYETDFAPSNQRNIFRQGAQKRLDLSMRKTFNAGGKISLQYEFNVFNVTNTTSPDVPQDQTQIRQNSACSNNAISYAVANDYNCQPGSYYYVNYGQIVTGPSPADQASAKANLDQIPTSNGTGKNLTIPFYNNVGQVPACTTLQSTGNNQCPNNGANFGSVTGVIGSARIVTMGVHVNF